MASVALSRTNNAENQQRSVESGMSNPTVTACNGSQQQQGSQISTDQQRYYSSRREYITVPGEDDSKRPLLSRSSANSSSGYCKSNEPVVLKDMTELQQHLELMHDRCIARNLRAAGLGGFDVEEESIYGNLDPNAHLVTGETMLTATILYLKETDRLHHYVAILLNDGANVNEPDAQGKTALVHAIRNKRYKAAKALTRHEKTDLFACDNEGNTALMHAAIIGAEPVLYYFFKALRKREKRSAHHRQLAQEDSEKGKDKKETSQTQTSDVAGSNTAEEGRELWSSLRNDDPLDTRNHRGETAHALALKHKHIECANMISDEKVRRAREMAKRLNAISHQRGGGSPSIIRLAKRSARRYFKHYGSLDSLYFDRDDESDDELILTASHMHRSRTADEGMVFKEEAYRTYPVTPRHQQPEAQNQPNAKRGLLVRLNKRFQSNPDLFRCKASASCIQVPERSACGPAAGEGQAPFPIREQPVACSNERENGEREKRNIARSISGGMTKPVEQAEDAASHAHQPVIKRTSTHQQQRRRPVPAAAQYSHKRNIAEKLMSFLRLRPKYMVPPDGAGDSSSSKHTRAGIRKKDERSQNFDSINQQDDDDHEAHRAIRKGYSQSDINPKGKSAKQASKAYKVAERTCSAPQRNQLDLKQRRSMDSAICSVRSQPPLAKCDQKKPDVLEWGPEQNEDIADAAMVTITPLPSPLTPASTRGQEAPAFTFPQLAS